ncbi:MAG: DNA-binding response regulator [Anaerolineaceae bacterium 4572_78]|nr:MAG: DNA-binding response regulator [Anaerolineaceae bacterium 4572_78]
MNQETILVVDDEQNIIELVKLYLTNEGFAIEQANDGLSALEKVDSINPILMILDLMLPELDGWEVCKRVRAKSNLPIIMVTARRDDVDKIVGLELGADDYLTKPFNPRELVARVKAVLRRGYQPPPPTSETGIIKLGKLTLDVPRREVRVDEKRIELRTKEFDLLQVLVEHGGKVLSRDQLLDLAWGFDFFGETRTVDVHVGNLRRKLGNDMVNIETVWGVGYKISIVD